MKLSAFLRHGGALALCAALFAAALPPPAVAAPGLSARAGAAEPDADAVRLAELWAELYFTPEQLAAAYAPDTAPNGFPREWAALAAPAAAETVAAERPRIIRVFAEVMQTVGTPAERHAGAAFLTSPVGRRMLVEASKALAEGREMDLPDADKRELLRRMEDPLTAAFVGKMGQIDEGMQARLSDLMRIFVPGMFRRWGEKMEALPRAPLSAEEEVGVKLAGAAVDVDGFLKDSQGSGFDDLRKMIVGAGLPEAWGVAMVEEMEGAVAGPGRAAVLRVVGQAYARHMSPEELSAAVAFFATPAGQEVSRKLRRPGDRVTLGPAAQRAYDAFLKTPAGKAFQAANDAIARESASLGEDLGYLIMPTAFRRFGARLEALGDNGG